jgi:hypothetical protein
MSSSQLGLVLLVAVIVAVVVAADRRRTIAVCIFEGGKVRIARGRLSPRVLTEVRDVAERNRLSGGKLVIRRENRQIRLDLDGVTDARAAQQLRNVLGRFRLPELTS